MAPIPLTQLFPLGPGLKASPTDVLVAALTNGEKSLATVAGVGAVQLILPSSTVCEYVTAEVGIKVRPVRHGAVPGSVSQS